MKLSSQVATSLTALTSALLVSCSGMPGSSGLFDTSRTGRVHDIKIAADQVEPKRIIVQPGDEIRWVNHRTAPVNITFTDPLDQKLTCERHFAQITGLGHSTKVAPNQSASLCFAGPGVLTYMARMEANVPGNEIIDSGSIEIVSGQSEAVGVERSADLATPGRPDGSLRKETQAGGVPAQPAMGRSQIKNDPRLAEAVRERLIQEKVADPRSLHVEADRERVYLDGTVDTPEKKRQAAEIAQHVSGASIVDNQLHVQPTGAH